MTETNIELSVVALVILIVFLGISGLAIPVSAAKSTDTTKGSTSSSTTKNAAHHKKR